MEKVSWIIVLVSVFLVLLFLSMSFVLLYRSRKRLLYEKHHDDIVEENIALLYAGYLKERRDRDCSFPAFLDRRKKRKRTRGILLDVVLALVSLVLLAVLAAAVALRATGGQMTFGGTAFYVVETDSMSEKNPDNDDLEGYDDQIPARTFILIETIDEDETLVPYAIYAYKDEAGEVIVHRLIKTMDDGTYLFRGDKNTGPIASDLHVERSQILGRFTGYQNHALGETVFFLKSPIGLVVLVGLLGVFVGQCVYSDKLDRLYEKRYDMLLPDAERLYAKYVRIDADRTLKKDLLDQIDLYPEGSVFYVLYGDGWLSTGERVEILKEEDRTCLCRIVSDVSDNPSLPIRVEKENLAFYAEKKR